METTSTELKEVRLAMDPHYKLCKYKTVAANVMLSYAYFFMNCIWIFQ